MVGVCIKYFHKNYGGMLQAYATVSLLEKYNIDYELIRYQKTHTPIKIIKSLPRLFNRVLLNDKYEAFLKEKAVKSHPEFAENNKIRDKAFSKFEKKHFVKLSPVFVGYNALCAGAERYDAVITGSDQLWSPAGLPTNYYNLMFVPSKIKKISYASSFGVKDIPWYQKKRTAEFLNRIEYISMREKRGSEIVKELTGRTVKTVLDPVFMFDSAEWENLIPCERKINEPYIFSYFLGDNPMYRSAVKKAAEMLGCKIVALRHLDRYVPEDENFGDYAPYDVAPNDFLNLLRNASYVCTDSFHGMCFSIIHNKKFVIFNRYSGNVKYSKNSRIDSLCEKLGLSSRRYSEENDFVKQLDFDIDYPVVNDKLNVLKKEAEEYLNSALKE